MAIRFQPTFKLTKTAKKPLKIMDVKSHLMMVVVVMVFSNISRLPVVVIRNHRTSGVRRRRFSRFHRFRVARLDRPHRRRPRHHRTQSLLTSTPLTAVAAAAEGDVVAVSGRLLRYPVRSSRRLRYGKICFVTLCEVCQARQWRNDA